MTWPLPLLSLPACGAQLAPACTCPRALPLLLPTPVRADCSKECQKKHWREGGHKEACAALAAKRAEREQGGDGGDAQQE